MNRPKILIGAVLATISYLIFLGFMDALQAVLDLFGV